MPRSPFLIVLVAVVCVAANACGPASPDPTAPTPGAAACAAGNLGACEEAILKALAQGDDVAGLVKAYAAARSRADGDDAFARWLEALTEARKKGGAHVAVPKGAKAPPTDAAALEAPAPFAPTVPERRHALMVAIAETAGLHYLAVVGKDGTVARYFPRDPLAPLVLGLVPHAVDGDPKMADDAAGEAALREAVEAARASDYVRASKAVDRIDALVASRDPFDAQSLRLQIVTNSLGMSKPRKLFGDDEPPPPRAPPEPRASDSAYYHLLRVKLDPKASKAYEKRRAQIHAALPAEVHGLVDALFAETRSACDAVPTPKFATVRDLAFARLHPAALRPAHAQIALGRLDLPAWYARYGELAALVERTKTGWLFAQVLALERGGAAGVVPAGSDVHRRVTKIALAHARGLLALAKSDPGRVGFGQVGFLMAPGNYVDPELRDTVVEVGRTSAAGVLASSEEPWDVLGAVFVSAFISFSMPPELREAHLTALQGAFTARLRGDLAKKTGWGVAMAYALDAAYRLAFGLGPDLRGSVDQIGRALEADGVEQPGVAALTSALVRYGALAAEKSLGTPVLEGQGALPGRTAARAALKKALARLGDGSTQPPAQALEDLTNLLDGAAATLAFTIAEDIRADPPRPAQPGKKCVKSDEAPADPRVVRALGKLGDLRKKVTDNKAIREGTDAWSKRARLVALVVSDAVDVARAVAEPAKKDADKPKGRFPELPRARFHVRAADADATIRQAAATFGADAVGTEAAASSYAIVRGYLERGPAYLDKDGLKDLSAFFQSLGKLLAEDRETSATARLFSVFARSIGARGAVTPLFVDVARQLYKDGERQQADMILLAALIVASLSEETVHPASIELADAEKSHVGWALKFMRETRRLEKGERMDPASFVPGLESLLREKCAIATPAALAEVLGAVQKFRDGQRDAARTELDAWLDRVEKKLTVPRVSYAFRQETETRVFNLTLEIGLGGGVLGAVHGFNLGVGAKSAGDPILALDTTVDAPDAKRTRDDTARYYAHAAALAGVMHFASGDAKKGEIAAARALGVVTQRSWLYVPGLTTEPEEFAADAKATMAVLGQQAAESGRPFLAGSLFSVVRSWHGGEDGPDGLEAILDPAPPVLAGSKDLAPLFERTKKTLRALASGLPCGGPKLDKAVYLKATCETYPTSLSLRIADALAALPTLDAKGKGAACADLGALDAFLTPASSGRYEPDRLQDAVQKLLEADKVYDASVLLTRHRQPVHCTPALLAHVRSAAGKLERAPASRADLLSVAVNCGVGSVTPALVADLTALDDEIRRIGDTQRELDTSLFAVGLALQHGDAKPLAALAGKPDFVSRHRENGPVALGVALVLDHAARAFAGEAPRIAETQADVDLLCGTVPPADRAELCRLIDVLRTADRKPEDRKKAAEATLRKLLGQ